MKLIIVRHGRTKENEAKITQGHMHGELNQQGKRQALRVAERLKKESIDIIYCSDLNRAKQTAEPIIKEHPKTEIVYTKELREGNRGVVEGKLGIEAKEHMLKQNIPHEYYNWETGESLLQVQARAVNFYNKMLHNHRGKTVLWITHGMFLTLFLLFLHKKQFNEWKLHKAKNTAITILEVSDDNSHKILKENCIKHLKD